VGVRLLGAPAERHRKQGVRRTLLIDKMFMNQKKLICLFARNE